ncbi:MAG: hypothetical protein KME52_18395 [Desmonostoc geniculatum HA4340-LM1]|jgi:hypothetical protein|nr:hypothetical protein [Desmonostoc geniculatum HA4340-LM1]
MHSGERNALPIELNSETELEPEEFTGDLQAAASGDSNNQSSNDQTENSIYNFNAILDSLET